MEGLTPFARKYSPAPGQQKSCLTPLSPRTTYNQDTLLQIEKYQQHMLSGYTTRELMDLDAYSNRELNPSNLTNPIHQIMARDRWTLRDWPPLVVPGGSPLLNNGYWYEGNDLVWEVMKPCLRLASRMCSHFHTHPWVCEAIQRSGIGHH